MQDILMYSLIVASVSFTISEAAIFSKLRFQIKLRSKFFGKLVCCGYCIGHWVAAFVMIVYQPRLFFSFAPIDYICTWFVLSWIAGIQWGLMCILFKISGK